MQRRGGQANSLSHPTRLVTDAKGGVGTSTVALNLSLQIDETARKRVVLLDDARPFGKILLMLSIDPRFTVLDALGRVDRLNGNLFASVTSRHKGGIAFLVVALHAPMRHEQRQSSTIGALTRLIGITASAFDYVVVDRGGVGPGFARSGVECPRL